MVTYSIPARPRKPYLLDWLDPELSHYLLDGRCLLDSGAVTGREETNR